MLDVRLTAGLVTVAEIHRRNDGLIRLLFALISQEEEMRIF